MRPWAGADIVHRATFKFKEIAERTAGGELEAQVYPNSAPGSLRVPWFTLVLPHLFLK